MVFLIHKVSLSVFSWVFFMIFLLYEDLTADNENHL